MHHQHKLLQNELLLAFVVFVGNCINIRWVGGLKSLWNSVICRKMAFLLKQGCAIYREDCMLFEDRLRHLSVRQLSV